LICVNAFAGNACLIELEIVAYRIRNIGRGAEPMIANDIKDRPRRVTAPNGNAHPVVRDLRPSEMHSAAFRRTPEVAWPKPNRENALARKLGNFIPLSRGELHCLANLQSKSEEIASRTDLAYEGQIGQRAYILQSGWA
jgi:hypothetical protein